MWKKNSQKQKKKAAVPNTLREDDGYHFFYVDGINC
jgi:hypothetical protein